MANDNEQYNAFSNPIDITVILADQSFGYEEMYSPEDIQSFDFLKDALAELNEYRFTYLDNHSTLLEQLKNNPPAFVLNLCDDGFKNGWDSEPHIPSYLEMLDIPYSGAGPNCLYLCYNKAFVSAIAKSIGVPTPEEFIVNVQDAVMGTTSAAQLKKELEDFTKLNGRSYPVLVKPTSADGSAGITTKSLIYSPQNIFKYIGELGDEAEFYNSLLIQEFLTGNEYHVGIIGNIDSDYEVLPILEVDYSRLPKSLPSILTSDSKWNPGSTYQKCVYYKDAHPDDKLKEKLVSYSKALFKKLECRDYARFDFRLDEKGTPKIIDVNPNPSWAYDGKMNIMAGWAGFSYSDWLDKLIKVAYKRTEKQRQKQLITIKYKGG